jgi:hypothetical protein
MALLGTIAGMFKKSGQHAAPETSQIEEKSPYVVGEIDEEKVASEIKREFEKRREKRVVRELQWQLNREFRRGNQYCDINTSTRTVEEIPFVYDDEEREVFNLIAPKIEARLAKINKVTPALLTRPASDSHRDISTSKVSTKVLRGTYVHVNMQEHFKTANAWAEDTGTVFHKDLWNPALGRVVANDGEEVVHEGDIWHGIVPSFEVYPEDEEIEDEQAQSIFHAKPYSVDRIEELYGIKVTGTTLDVYNLENSRISVGGMGYTASIQRFSKGQRENAALVIEAYFPSCKKYPRGKMITVIGSRVVVYMDGPFFRDDGTPFNPFTKQVCVRDAGNFWGTTVIERMIPVQRRYNALKNRMHEFINRSVIPAWTAEQDTIVNMEEIRAAGINSGDVLERVPGSAPPTALQMPQLGYDTINEEERLRALMTEISGVSDFASQSLAPAGTPGVGMELIKQQDDSRVSLTAENIEIAAKKIGQKWLWLYKQYVKVPRMLKVVGDEYTLSYVMEWSENDLTSFDVVLEVEDILTASLPQKRQQVMYFYSQGFFNDPATGTVIPSMRAKLMEMFDMGNLEESVSLDNLHIRRANEENAQFRQGLVPQINPLDQDDLHVREHTRFALTTEFEDLAKENPELRQFMLEHIQLHQAATLQKTMMGQPQMQQLGPQPGQAAMTAPDGGNPYGQHIAISG